MIVGLIGRKIILNLIEKINNNSYVDKITGCILWDKALNTGGYAHTRFNGKLLLVHRIVWEHYNGPIPAGLWVLHRCDVRNCINLNHLFLGTRLDNILDMVAKNRHSKLKGVNHPRVKLTEKEVLEIRASKEADRKICKRYDVSRSLIGAIRRKEIWDYI